jgi:hypothetical protein
MTPAILCRSARRRAPLSAALALAVAVASASAAACEGELSEEPIPQLQRLVPGEAQLAGWGGERACSHGDRSAGDGHRWCAFHRPSAEDRTRTELWVMDVTRALAGEAPACDGSSPACLKMTGRLFTELRIGSMSHPEAHRFEGDTLFFLAEPYPSERKLDRFEGYVWAWRPGWQRPRTVTSERGVQCQGSSSGKLAFCIDGASDEPLEFDLRAGPLVDADDSLLPLVERLAPIREGGIAWTARFSEAEDHFIYSSWRNGEPSEDLRVLPVAEMGSASPRTVAADGWWWTLSADGRAVFFMRGGDRERGEGALWAADFPSGARATQLAAGVSAFEPLAGQGITFITDLRGLEGLLNVVRDRLQPQARYPLAPDAHAWYPLGDGRFTYVLQVDDSGAERGLIGDNQQGTACRLGSSPDVVAYSAGWIANLGAVHWTEPDPADETLPGLTFFAQPQDCGQVRLLGRGLQYLSATGARGLIVGTAPSRDERELSFYHLPSVGEDPLAGATPFLQQVSRDNIAVVGATEAMVLGTPESAQVGRGLHIFGPLSPARPAAP